MASTFRRYGEQIIPPIFRDYWGERLFGTYSVLVDALAEGMRGAAISSWYRSYKSTTVALSDDAIAALSRQQHQPRYLNESRGTFLSRLRDTWTTWQRAGGYWALTTQLAAAGYPNSEILYSWSAGLPGDISATQWEGEDWGTEFWVWIPEGSHGVTVNPVQYGDEGVEYGDGHVYGGLAGISRAEITQLRRIVEKWKPGLWVCRHILFDLGSGNYAKLAGFRGGGLGDYL